MTRLWLRQPIPFAILSMQMTLASCATEPKQIPPALEAARPAQEGLPLAEGATPKTKAPALAAAAGIELCPIEISNPPPLDKDGKVIGGSFVAIKGVRLLLQPATNVCLSSGYGPRNGKLHRGVDYHTRTRGDVLAAGDGTILEAATRADFGNMVVIDHGGGVYTRYAHLGSFDAAAKHGAPVRSGVVLGPIGATGATSVRHLHFEVMTGKYVSGVGTFGLSTHNPFDLPPP